jgi:hypothetical protein
MITFNPNLGRDLVLTHSPMLRAYLATARYLAQYDAIGLTKSGAWNRTFIEWAVAEIDFPGWTADDLYAVNKVLNEYDVAPLEYLHALMDGLKWGRKYKGTYRFSRAGLALAKDPETAFAAVIPAYLFRFNHSEGMHSGEAPMGNWDIFLNVLNLELRDGITAGQLAEVLYGDATPGWGSPASGLTNAVLRPLCWAGLLCRKGDLGLQERIYHKTPLWPAALVLETDARRGAVIPLRSG